MFCMNPCHCVLCPDTLRTDFSNVLLGSMISCSQPLQRSLKSAPVRRISHSLLPQGWGFFICTISPIRYGITSFFCFLASVSAGTLLIPTIYTCFWFLLSEAVLIALFLFYFLHAIQMKNAAFAFFSVKFSTSLRSSLCCEQLEVLFTLTSSVSVPRFPRYYRGKYNQPLRLSLWHHG